MDFSWDEDTLAEAKRVVQFAQTELKGDVRANDRNCEFDRKNWQRCAEYGIMGWLTPQQYGGSGYTALKAVRLLEAFGYGCEDTGLAYAVSSQMLSIQPAILKFGTDEQIQRFFPQLLNGKCGAFGITEAGSGSDAFSMQTTAKRVDGGYILNGNKKFCTLAPVADVAVVFANTNPNVGRWGITGFIVEKTSGGFHVSGNQPKMGMRTTPFGDLILDDCFVPDDQRLGPEGAGHSIFTISMNSERGYIFATQMGAMQRQLERATDYAKDRKQFGKSIGQYQAVSHRIVDMKLRHELAQLILYKVAWQEDHGESTSMAASLAKLHMSESLVESGLDAIRTHGVRGYMPEFDVERDLRDSIGGLIYSGTSDIQKNIIASLLGL